MNTATKLAVGASTLAAAAIIGPMHASAATAHCPAGGTKVEVSGDSATRFVGTQYNGLHYCIKAGTGTTEGTVTNGTIRNTEITNKAGKPLGISYYVIYGQPCVPSGSSGSC